MRLTEKQPGYESKSRNGRHGVMKKSLQSDHIVATIGTCTPFPTVSCSFSKYIPLPVLAKYPLRELSQVQSNFGDLSYEYPELANQFNLLQKVKDYCLDNSLLKMHSICITKKTDNTAFIEIEFRCEKDKKSYVEELLTPLGL